LNIDPSGKVDFSRESKSRGHYKSRNSSSGIETTMPNHTPLPVEKCPRFAIFPITNSPTLNLGVIQESPTSSHLGASTVDH
jgi:hypothetical protein